MPMQAQKGDRDIAQTHWQIRC